ncbi:MAG: glycosyltransferase family 39 protein [Leptonema sp. (in: Bacteria)]|nr:glycosyltransferase family 39 protein [Leptonema sp. (in: bacteria)]
MKINQKPVFILLLILSILPTVLLLPADVMDIDSAQYAEIGREMTDSNQYLYLRDNGRKYLDKPIFTFWMVSASFKLFGQNNISFRLPSLLFALLSIYSIYQLVLLRSKRPLQGWLAALLYASSPGLFSMLVSPLIDIYLTSFLIFTHHAYYLARKKGNRNYFYLMYLFMGFGFITKGPIAIVIPCISIGVDLLIRRDIKGILSMRIPEGIIITAILPLFWSYLLFQEFSWYGPHFFVIIQSFGRFYSFIYNQKYDPLYFIKNFSWAFGLFILPLIGYVWFKLRNDIQSANSKNLVGALFTYVKSDKFRKSDFVIVLWLFLTLFLISFSKFQLPQYIYWILPAGAIYMAEVLDRLFFDYTDNSLHRPPVQLRSWWFYVVPVILVLVFISIPVLAFDFNKWDWLLYCVAILPVAMLFWPQARKAIPTQMLLPLVVGISIHLSVSLLLYGKLIQYQPSSKIAKTVSQLEPNKEVLYKFMISNSQRSYAFYSKRYTRDIFRMDQFDADLKADGERLLILSAEGKEHFDNFTKGKYHLEVLEEHDSYKVSMPSQAFFNKKKRPNVLRKVYLAKVTFAK